MNYKKIIDLETQKLIIKLKNLIFLVVYRVTTTLMKILQIFQKATEKSASAEGDSSLLSEKDIEQLFHEVTSISKNDLKQLDI